MPCAVWQTEHEKPSCDMWLLCLRKLALLITLLRLWHLAHMP